jgi:hypothetical protein
MTLESVRLTGAGAELTMPRAILVGTADGVIVIPRH